MPPTSAKSGFGTILKIGDGEVSEAFTTIAEIHDITPPSTSLATVDATNMESPDGFTEVIATLLESGPVELDLNLIEDDSSQALLRTDAEAKTLRNFQVVLPGAAYQYTFAAYVTNLGPATPRDGRMSQSVTLTVSGKATYGTVS
tara:strand:- start:1396 stop:1830 length:435 start_codon:yes stop_codon:yes gene_type:complete